MQLNKLLIGSVIRVKPYASKISEAYMFCQVDINKYALISVKSGNRLWNSALIEEINKLIRIAVWNGDSFIILQKNNVLNITGK